MTPNKILAWKNATKEELPPINGRPIIARTIHDRIVKLIPTHAEWDGEMIRVKYVFEERIYQLRIAKWCVE